ncbi:phosphatase PAP2 family protein [Streptomyces virginiae]|uniref:phosphatase PAP2 family protein n=1 Tax=Streptomyces virginiae TaxID=1961 RepID=UPI003F51624A
MEINPVYVRSVTMDTSGLYRVVTGFAHAAPVWVQRAFEIWTEYGLPCRAVAGAAASLVRCPPPGNWSFPGNHATVAGAAAVALALAVRRLAPLVVPLALLMALSRVFVGVHYPRDVALGLLLGGSVAALLVLALTGPAAKSGSEVRNVPGCRMP